MKISAVLPPPCMTTGQIQQRRMDDQHEWNGYEVKLDQTIHDEKKFLATVSCDAVSVSPVSRFPLVSGPWTETTSIFHIQGIAIVNIPKKLLRQICKKLANDPLISIYKKTLIPKRSDSKYTLCVKIQAVVGIWEMLVAKSNDNEDQEFSLTSNAKWQLRNDIRQFNKNALEIIESWVEFDRNAAFPISHDKSRTPYVWKSTSRTFVLTHACNQVRCRHCPCSKPFPKPDEEFSPDKHCSAKSNCDYLERVREKALDKKMTIEQLSGYVERQHGLPLFKKMFPRHPNWFLAMLECRLCLVSISCRECNIAKARDMQESGSDARMSFERDPDYFNETVESAKKILKWGFLGMWRAAWNDFKKREQQLVDEEEEIEIDFDFGWFDTLYIVDLGKCLGDKAFLDVMEYYAPCTILSNIPNIHKYVLEEDYMVAAPGRNDEIAY